VLLLATQPRKSISMVSNTAQGHTTALILPEILGIPKTATKSEVKKAYHKVCFMSASQKAHAGADDFQRQLYNTTLIKFLKIKERSLN
jgi:hypothetical protein